MSGEGLKASTFQVKERGKGGPSAQGFMWEWLQVAARREARGEPAGQGHLEYLHHFADAFHLILPLAPLSFCVQELRALSL